MTTAIDVFDPRAYEHGIPYDAFARLRAETPVSWQEEPAVLGWPAGPGFWAVMRYDDVRHVSRTPADFSAFVGCTQLRDPEPEDLDFTRQMMLNMDPPQHNVLRKTVSKAFTPSKIRRFSDMIARRARLLVDGVIERGECDFAEDVSDELPLLTLAEIMGVPDSDRHLLFKWANRVIGYQDDEFGTADPTAGPTADPTAGPAAGAAPKAGPASKPVNPRSRAALTDMFEYAHDLAEHKRRNPADDLITTLVHAEVDGRPLTDEEFEMFFFLLTVAGNDTSRSVIPAGVLTFTQHRDQWRLLVEQPDLMEGAVEEVLRHCPPVIHFRRTATRDVELRGQRIKQGDKVVVFYPSANRDPEVFAEPDRFDVTRDARAHLSFGEGPHVCLGAGFARLQLRHMFTEVLTRMPDLEITGDVEYMRSNFISGIKRMPVRFTPGPRLS